MFFFYFFLFFFFSVISVGGDGMFHEVLNGLVIRAQQDAMLDSTSYNFQPIPLNLPIGIIPAGESSIFQLLYLIMTDRVT